MLPLLVLLLVSTPAAPSALPGAEAFPPELSQRLEKALADKGAGYKPRTEHLKADGSPEYTNRLILEASPYLLQHAHNPVNWYPWGEEAFERARRENKPILLSVGYSTCHWCHVMERESFEDEEIAAYLNRNYVAIKVDREQRPDVDGVYMTAVQLMSGSGGWPMTVWLTPERKPFYGGTYFPPRDGARAGRPGFLTLLTKLRQAYEQKPDQVAAAAQDIAAQLQAAAAAPQTAAALDATAAMSAAAEGHRRSFDRANGGFGSAPKFPRPAGLQFLLRYGRRMNDAQARDMAVATLAAMQAGGIHDQIGGGFHRYSTDERWRVPHFEKMLYDNALLTLAYLDAYQASGRAEFAEVARRTLAYVAREMTSPDGAFYSASDADSGGVEGAFFLWTPDEVAAVLGPERAKWFDDLYGVTAAGDLDGRSVLHLAVARDQVARDLAVDGDRLAVMADEARQALYEARGKRVAPHVDRKVVASWNGLMVSAFARAAFVLADEADASRASRAAEFLRARMTAGGRLHRSAVDGRAEGVGYLDDYAFVIQGLLDLFEATAEAQWLRQALLLQKSLDAHFWDAAGGGYFLTPDDGEALLVRQKPDDDGAEPSGNAVAIAGLLRLGEWTGDEAYRRRAEQALAAFAATVQREPMAVPAMLAALDLATGTPKEIALVEPANGADADGEALLAVLRRTYLPNRVAVVIREGAPLAAAAEIVPWLRGKQALGGKTTAYVCERYVCALPTTKADVFAKQLQAQSPTPTDAPVGGR